MDVDYSYSSLLRFLEYIEEKGLANPHTARVIRIAVQRLIGDSIDEPDVRKVDLDVAARRFQNKSQGALAPTSLAQYRQRVQVAVREFVRYNEDPVRYKGFGRGLSAEGPERISTRIRRPLRKEREQDELSDAETSAAGPDGRLVMAFPLRPDFLARIVVPRDLKLEEARRLSAFIATLASDYRTD